MGAYGGRRTFRIAPLAIGVLGGALALFSAGCTFMYFHDPSSWTFRGLASFAALSAVALLDWVVTRVELEDDAIVVRTLWSRRRYARSEIEGVAEEKGVPPGLKLAG